MRLGHAKFENKVFICHCSRLSLYLYNIGCGLAKSIKPVCCFCSRLSLYLPKNVLCVKLKYVWAVRVIPGETMSISK
ncbi:MAG TPA: hypothetical protein DEQ93_07670 [Odoribacter splanchnicus]|uniref:Uncharacterized protein n=1 Tax=Odoribacter splanchnicus TaxID=28118 RepID=A0A412TWV1_9BACT|nr:hypothetical protein DWW57_03365 [Odoribacter splanchnicus]RHA43353.1 hypothetical protein DW936_01005 [Odoribacter splanchnicus]RHD86472.1 hypothetical protein DW778_05170 [Odoribacter splanchnicus]HCD93104.1 hypothetical protein [Odoribacter splanchnicus]HCG22518.1 hypothetical protein [Odoribacter splanchnicus]